MTLSEFYVYDGSNLLLVLDGSGNVKQRYLNGPNENQVLAEETNIVANGAGDTHWALTYPNGRVITYSYGTSGGPNDRLNRVDSIQDTTSGVTILASYTYVGV